MDEGIDQVSKAIGALEATTKSLADGQQRADSSRRVTHEKVDLLTNAVHALTNRITIIETVGKDIVAMKPAVDQCSNDHKELAELKPKVETLMRTRLVLFALVGGVAFLAVIAGHGPVAKAGEFILAIFGAL